MVRTLGRWGVGVAAVVGGLFLTAGALVAEPKAADFASIHDIMKTGHGGKKSLLNQIKAGVKDGNWAEIEKPAKTLKKYGEELGKNTPDKGDAASWKKLTASYQTMMTDIAEGVEKKDAKATNAALAKMQKSCKACHDNHKE
jgi:hypothetical protein